MLKSKKIPTKHKERPCKKSPTTITKNRMKGVKENQTVQVTFEYPYYNKEKPYASLVGKLFAIDPRSTTYYFLFNTPQNHMYGIRTINFFYGSQNVPDTYKRLRDKFRSYAHYDPTTLSFIALKAHQILNLQIINDRPDLMKLYYDDEHFENNFTMEELMFQLEYNVTPLTLPHFRSATSDKLYIK